MNLKEHFYKKNKKRTKQNKISTLLTRAYSRECAYHKKYIRKRDAYWKPSPLKKYSVLFVTRCA